MIKRKHYRDLSIDEPLESLPRGMVLEAEAELKAMTPEQRKAEFEEAWFQNPGGHFRRRILRKLERAGGVKHIVMPDGQQVLRFADKDDPLLDLLTAVGGELDEPYDPERTRDDYNNKEQVQ